MPVHDYYGKNIAVRIEGGSHSPEMTLTFDGLPAGLSLDKERLREIMERRRPGKNAWSTARQEEDRPVFVSGLKDGMTDGKTLVVRIRNYDMRPGDYKDFADVPRPGHADYPARMKYGPEVDLSGGGHYSGRLTSLLCVAGEICRQNLERKGVYIGAHIERIHTVLDRPFPAVGLTKEELRRPGSAAFPVLEESAGEWMKKEIELARENRDSVGGIIECAAIGLPLGLGTHMFDSLESRVSSAMFAIPGVKGVSFGEGFRAASLFGSENNDGYYTDGKEVFFASNHAGGVLGGMSTGMPLVVHVAIKPTPTIAREQDSVSLSRMENVKLNCAGRHDPCIVPRAVPVTESVLALALFDLFLDGEGTVGKQERTE
ncbi:MAG: chorismate synthase [Clostridia bacterium]|nr:chorismate synthase [Clostridia bacterium]